MLFRNGHHPPSFFRRTKTCAALYKQHACNFDEMQRASHYVRVVERQRTYVYIIARCVPLVHVVSKSECVYVNRWMH